MNAPVAEAAERPVNKEYQARVGKTRRNENELTDGTGGGMLR